VTTVTGESRRVRLGTASWTDKTLTQQSDWYPKKSMSAAERLGYYASIFPMAEVDATYYFPPTQHLVGLWVERTPADFRMNVKAYALLTGHPADAASLWADVAEAIPSEHAGKPSTYLSHLPDDAVDAAFEHFRDALMPLHSAGKLGAVFFQFPKWFTPRRDNRAFLESLPARLPDYRVAVEFRNHRWLDDETCEQTLDLLEQAGLAYVCVDGPQGFASSVPPVVAATADLAVVRFHGHNTQSWEAKGISTAERFKYFYSDAELADWVPAVRQLADSAGETHVVMNNCYRDYGVRNARRLGQLLDEGLQTGAEGSGGPDAAPGGDTGGTQPLFDT
jgi:uncharacterized protein YecE (DUF72 family)